MGEQPAIIGLGLTSMSLEPGGHASQLASEAISRALADAGLERARRRRAPRRRRARACDPTASACNSPARTASATCGCWSTSRSRGPRPWRWCSGRCSPSAPGSATTVVCVFADAPIQPGGSTGSTYARSGGNDGAARPGTCRRTARLGADVRVDGVPLPRRHGRRRARPLRRRVQRAPVGAGNPDAVLRTPLSADDYFAARMISTPLRVLDCARPVNGGGAVVVSSTRPGGARPRTGARPRHGSAPPCSAPPRWERVMVRRRRRYSSRRCLGPGRPIPRRSRRGRDLRPVLGHHPVPAGGLRLGRSGNRWQGRPLGRDGARRRPAGEHRWRAAVRLLPAGHDAAGRGHHPGARHWRRPPGARCLAPRSSPGSAADSTTTPS